MCHENVYLNVHGTICNSNQWWNNNKCQCECKKLSICEKDYVWNPARCNCENVKYIGSIMGDSVIIRDEITYSEEKSFNLKNKTCKTQHFYVLLAF